MRISATGPRTTSCFPRGSKHRRPRGFSLIEIVAVIVIIGVLSAMMVPSLVSGLNRARVNGAITRITQTMALCGNLAATDSQPFRLNFNPGTGRFWITFEPDPLEQPGVFAPLRLSDMAAWQLDESIRIRDYRIAIEAQEVEEQADEAPFIEFRPDGTCDGIMMIIETDSEDVYTIVLSPITGRVRVFDYEVGEEGHARPGTE